MCVCVCVNLCFYERPDMSWRDSAEVKDALLLLNGAGVWFPALYWCDLQLHLTAILWHLVPSCRLFRYPHTVCAHIYLKGKTMFQSEDVV